MRKLSSSAATESDLVPFCTVIRFIAHRAPSGIIIVWLSINARPGMDSANQGFATGQRKSKGPSIRVRLVPAILRQLRKIGFHIEPFFAVREGASGTKQLMPNTDFRFDFIVADEFEQLANFVKTESRHTLRKWLDEGKRCYAVWDGPRLIANMWCDFEEFSFAPNYRALDDDEVYLFAAYSHPDYRGQSVAPTMRLRCYEALRALGKSRFYSYTEFFNAAARRFKEKLGARNEALRLYICLFGRWSRTITLRRYS